MIILNVFLTLKPGQGPAFVEATKNLVAQSRAEEGNHLYSLYQQTDQEDNYIIVEHWKDAAAIELHNATEHFQHFAANVSQYLAAPLDMKKYEI